jgi:hypothetical protein
MVTPPPDPSRWLEREKAIERVWRVLDRLPQMAAAILYFWAEGTPSTEIGSTLGIAPESVRKALTRARREFRTAYRLMYKADFRSGSTGEGMGRVKHAGCQRCETERSSDHVAQVLAIDRRTA